MLRRVTRTIISCSTQCASRAFAALPEHRLDDGDASSFELTAEQVYPYRLELSARSSNTDLEFG